MQEEGNTSLVFIIWPFPEEGLHHRTWGELKVLGHQFFHPYNKKTLIHLKQVNFTGGKLYLNKAVENEGAIQ